MTNAKRSRQARSGSAKKKQSQQRRSGGARHLWLWLGIGAVILNGARVGKNCLIAAKALVGENKVIPDNSVVMGVPGRIRRQTTAEEIAHIAWIPPHYVKLAQRWANGEFASVT